MNRDFKVGDVVYYKRYDGCYRVGIINRIKDGYMLWCNFKSYYFLPKSNQVTKSGDDETWVDKSDANLLINININRRIL
jgi:hypothetical protein